MTATTELAGLLRGCLKWDDDRPRVDNDALLVVADWCEENGRADVAEAIRRPEATVRLPAMAITNAGAYAAEGTGITPVGPYCVNAFLGFGDSGGGAAQVCRRRNNGPLVLLSFLEGAPEGFAHAAEGLGSAAHNWALSVYRTEDSEASAGGALSPDALPRVAGLARWDCICRMLGHPPLRLVCEG